MEFYDVARISLHCISEICYVTLPEICYWDSVTLQIFQYVSEILVYYKILLY